MTTTTPTRNRFWFEADRTFDFLSRLPPEHPLWERTLEKLYRLTALSSGETEAEAEAYASDRMYWWRFDALAEAARIPKTAPAPAGQGGASR